MNIKCNGEQYKPKIPLFWRVTLIVVTQPWRRHTFGSVDVRPVLYFSPWVLYSWLTASTRSP